MADTGFIFAGATGQISGPDVAWTSVGNLLADDGSDAVINLTAAESSRIVLVDQFDFSSLPTSITIDGITVQMVDYLKTGVDVDWTVVRLQLADDTAGTNNREADLLGYTASDQTDEAGGVSELWFETIGRADVTDPDWGVRWDVFSNIGGIGNLDAVKMRVNYTLDESVAVTGTVVGATEAQIAAGGRTLLLDLTGATWAASGATFDAQRQNIIDGIDSAQTETLGWNNEVRDTMSVGRCVRTSSTRVTITLLASEVENYKITADEVLTATIPASAHSGASPLVDSNFATITAQCDETLAPDTIATQTNLTGAVTDIDESVDSPDANWLVAA